MTVRPPTPGSWVRPTAPLYGTTLFGGVSGTGTVFTLRSDGSIYAEQVLYAFRGGADGAFPAAALILHRGSLYRTTSGGGTHACTGSWGPLCGTAFRIAS